MLRLISLLLAVVLAAPSARAAGELLGPVAPMMTLDEFSAAGQGAWTARSSDNVEYRIKSGINIPAVADSLLQLDFTRKEETGNAWFSMNRDVAPGSIAPEADGLRLLIGSPGGGKWWMQIIVHVGNESFQHVIEPIYPDRTIIEHTIRFEEFTSDGRPMDRSKAPAIDAISMVISPRNATLYFDRISTYRQERYNSWLDVSSSRPNHNIFQPGEKITLTFKPGGNVPAHAKEFRYEIVDFFEKPVSAGRVPLDGSAEYAVSFDPPSHGYYEMKAFWQDAVGVALENRSCIRAEGSLPDGLMTFSVMSRTVEENLARFKELGADAYFGLHGDAMGIADLMGLSWRMGYTRWPYVEPTKPELAPGERAPWAAKSLAEEPQPEFRFHFLPLSSNLAPPAWAKNPADGAPPFASWDEYLRHVRDVVAIEMHGYPHVKPRIYGVAWEIDLNMPPHNFKPIFSPADVAELHRRVSETIRSADPQAIIAGPCPSTMKDTWFKSIFEAGVLKYLDAIETHGYTDAFTPEAAGYAQTLSRLRELMQQYNNGKVLPIYITEAAFRGKLGSQIIHRTQAQVMTRQAIIFKAEGVKVFLPFYIMDYDRDGWWGFCFNLEVDGRNPWGTRRLSPKPTVNAMATCAQVLEGAKPVRRVKGLGEDVWAYLFDRQGTAILAIWTPEEAREIEIPSGAVQELESINIMGQAAIAKPQAGQLRLTISQSPQYLIGIPPQALPE